MKIRFRPGQAMLEYVLTFSALVAVVLIMLGLVVVAQRYAVRTERLVSSEYP